MALPDNERKPDRGHFGRFVNELKQKLKELDPDSLPACRRIDAEVADVAAVIGQELRRSQIRLGGLVRRGRPRRPGVAALARLPVSSPIGRPGQPFPRDALLFFEDALVECLGCGQDRVVGIEDVAADDRTHAQFYRADEVETVCDTAGELCILNTSRLDRRPLRPPDAA